MNTRLCISEILSNKTRSLISSFGIFLGVATLLILLSFMRAMQKDVNEKVVKMGGIDIIEIQQVEPETPEEELEFRRSPGLRLQNILDMKEQLHIIQEVLPEKSHGHSEITFAGNSGRGSVEAISYPHFKLFNFELGGGRYFSEDEYERGAKVGLMGLHLAERIFPPGTDPIGKKVSVLGQTLQIIGTIKTEQRWDRRARTIIYPFPTYQKYIGGVNSPLSSIKLKMADAKNLKTAKSAIVQYLLPVHRGVEDFDVILNEDKIKEMEATGKALNILLTIVATLSLFTGGISIMNIMFAVIGDRIREIGLRKALGAKKSDLFMQFMIESVLLCCTGALPGLFLGSIPAWLPSDLFPVEPFLNMGDYWLAMGFTLSVGLFAGFFPALKAANMRPIEALQYV